MPLLRPKEDDNTSTSEHLKRTGTAEKEGSCVYERVLYVPSARRRPSGGSSPRLRTSPGNSCDCRLPRIGHVGSVPLPLTVLW